MASQDYRIQNNSKTILQQHSIMLNPTLKKSFLSKLRSIIETLYIFRIKKASLEINFNRINQRYFRNDLIKNSKIVKLIDIYLYLRS